MVNNSEISSVLAFLPSLSSFHYTLNFMSSQTTCTQVLASALPLGESELSTLVEGELCFSPVFSPPVHHPTLHPVGNNPIHLFSPLVKTSVVYLSNQYKLLSVILVALPCITPLISLS